MTDKARPLGARDHIQDVLRLRRRIIAQGQLLVCYRIGRRPSETLFAELERTKKWATEIFTDYGFEVSGGD